MKGIDLIMIIIRLMGGLGNQIFQYAFYIKMKSLNKNVKLDLSAYNIKNLVKREIWN